MVCNLLHVSVFLHLPSRVEYQVKSRSIEQKLQTLRSELEVLKVDDGIMLLNHNQLNPQHPDFIQSSYEVECKSTSIVFRQ